jgi:hypothetical protein
MDRKRVLETALIVLFAILLLFAAEGRGDVHARHAS